MRKFFFAFVSILVVAGLGQAQVPQKSPPPLKLSDPMPGNLFVELGRVINPAVVNISTLAKPRVNNRQYRDPMLEMLEQFYGVPMQPRQQMPPQSGKPRPFGLGTGFIIREDGLIVTNSHVIQGADGIQVQLSEKAEKLYDAKVIGFDERTDIALIKITPDGKLPVAALGSSKDVEVGEWVAAFGNPYGHGHSMTKGIISSKGREIGEINKIPLLQTDASINPGNSGGPLVNSKGYVIGVNSAIDARAQGIGFAIPIDEVKAIIPQLEKSGRIEKGLIGVRLGDLDPNIDPEYLGLKDAEGAVIVSAERGGPAAKAGVKPYDIVTEFNGKKIKSSVDLMDAVSDAKIGSNATMKVIRDRKPVTLTVNIANRPDLTKGTEKAPSKGYSGQKAPFNLGFTVSDLSAALRDDYQIPSEVNNPMITEVERGSLASQAGFRVGDLILDVNKKEVSKALDVSKYLKKGSNTLRIVRGGALMIVTFDTK
ncbi:trypsin-like peptidase domain-containing protein [Bdellovibrio sp. HCB337]|uniref:trypsin-like peptidase domain-containing protein n=1 Tax=Bdellovibrio sp. HCB337 TaxID=3394358 RepID=UPI0039A49C16